MAWGSEECRELISKLPSDNCCCCHMEEGPLLVRAGVCANPQSLFIPPAGLNPVGLYTSPDTCLQEAVALLTSSRNVGLIPFQGWKAVPHDERKLPPLHLPSPSTSTPGERLAMTLTTAPLLASLWTAEPTITFRAWLLCTEPNLTAPSHMEDLSSQLCPGDLSTRERLRAKYKNCTQLCPLARCFQTLHRV